MKLLVGGSRTKLLKLAQFCQELRGAGVECRLVRDDAVYRSFPSRRPSDWLRTRSGFRKLVEGFRPDFVMTDRPGHFGMAAAREGLPLLIYLKGDYWAEREADRRTLYRAPHMRLALWQWRRIGAECFAKSRAILAVSRYLARIASARYPGKTVVPSYIGVETKSWDGAGTMELRHPCVGMVQNAGIYDKTRGMLSIEGAVRAMPRVTFYWAGDGPHRDVVLSRLKRYPNFVWLGSLDYADKLKRFMRSIDAYCLASGLDMMPASLLEAQLAARPVVASDVCGVPECLEDGRTGFLVDGGGWAEKIGLLMGDEKLRRTMGSEGRRFVLRNYSMRARAAGFARMLEKL